MKVGGLDGEGEVVNARNALERSSRDCGQFRSVEGILISRARIWMRQSLLIVELLNVLAETEICASCRSPRVEIETMTMM